MTDNGNGTSRLYACLVVLAEITTGLVAISAGVALSWWLGG